MNTVSFQDLTARALKSKRITFGDVRRLQRCILPDGIASREEAEVLIALEQVVRKVDPSWGDFLISAVMDFVVWGCRPTGHVDQDASRWLVARLSSGPATKTIHRLMREILAEAEQVDEALSSFAVSADQALEHVAEIGTHLGA